MEQRGPTGTQAAQQTLPSETGGRSPEMEDADCGRVSHAPLWLVRTLASKQVY